MAQAQLPCHRPATSPRQPSSGTRAGLEPHGGVSDRTDAPGRSLEVNGTGAGIFMRLNWFGLGFTLPAWLACPYNAPRPSRTLGPDRRRDHGELPRRGLPVRRLAPAAELLRPRSGARRLVLQNLRKHSCVRALALTGPEHPQRPIRGPSSAAHEAQQIGVNPLEVRDEKSVGCPFVNPQFAAGDELRDALPGERQWRRHVSSAVND